jgi:hypothetical protein
VSTGWQTVGQSSVKLANSWSVFGNNDKKFGPSSTMLANSWAVFGNVGKQLGSLMSEE